MNSFQLIYFALDDILIHHSVIVIWYITLPSLNLDNFFDMSINLNRVN